MPPQWKVTTGNLTIYGSVARVGDKFFRTITISDTAGHRDDKFEPYSNESFRDYVDRSLSRIITLSISDAEDLIDAMIDVRDAVKDARI